MTLHQHQNQSMIGKQVNVKFLSIKGKRKAKIVEPLDFSLSYLRNQNPTVFVLTDPLGCFLIIATPPPSNGVASIPLFSIEETLVSSPLSSEKKYVHSFPFYLSAFFYCFFFFFFKLMQRFSAMGFLDIDQIQSFFFFL